MQGSRGTVGSLHEVLDFDHGSTSSNAAIDHQFFWNDLMNPAENRLPEFPLPPSDPNIMHLNSVGHYGHDMGRWSLGEPSSTNSQIEVHCDESKKQHGWSSSLVASAETGPRLEEQDKLPDFLSLDNVDLNVHTNEIVNDPWLLQSPHSDSTAQSIDINARPPAHGGDDCQVIEHPNVCKFGISLNDLPPSASSSSDLHTSHSRNGRHLVEEIGDTSDRSLHGRRLSCKRKVFEGADVQSSVNQNSTFQHGESSTWRAVSARNDGGSCLNLSTPLENVLGIEPLDQVVMSPGMVAGGASSDNSPSINVPGGAESFRRNSRMRLNPSCLQDSVPTNMLSRGHDNGHLNISSPSQSLRFPLVNHSSDLGSAPTGDGTSSQNQSFVVRAPPLPRIGHSFRRNGASSSSPGNSSRSVISGVRNAMLHEEPNPRNMPTNITERSMPLPTSELGNSAQNSTNRSLIGGNTSILGNVVSRTGFRPPVISSSASSQVPHRNSSYPRRLSEALHRSLLESSNGPESGGQSSSYPPFHSGPASSQEMVHLSVAGAPRLPYIRSASLLDGQGDGILGFPQSLQNVSTTTEGRRRMLSEIRNALDLVRRGEGPQIENHFMLYNPSALVAGPDAHDRHRDMRLDVDNMSYEELLALGERIGNVNTGLSEETILKHLKQHKYSLTSIALDPMLPTEPCCICQEDYSEGDDLGTTNCGHEFHTVCIKQWLAHKNLCPICKTTALKKH